jgi:hypothetical protein
MELQCVFPVYLAYPISDLVLIVGFASLKYSGGIGFRAVDPTSLVNKDAYGGFGT